MKAYDDNGNEVFPIIINTICPIEYAEQSKQISADFIVSIFGEADVNQMLPELLKPIEGNEATHVFCSRNGLTHELQFQLDWLNNQNKNWISNQVETDKEVILSKFCTTTGDKQTLLNFLGLEEIN